MTENPQPPYRKVAGYPQLSIPDVPRELHRHPIPWAVNRVSLPVGTRPIHVQVENGRPTLYTLEPFTGVRHHPLFIVVTGEDPLPTCDLWYIASFDMNGVRHHVLEARNFSPGIRQGFFDEP